MATLDLATLRLILTTEDREYQRGLDSAQRKSDSWGKNLSKAVGGAAVAAFGIAAAAAADFARQSQEEFKQFDNGMREVFTLLPGISGDAMAQMEDQLLDAGAEMGRLSDEMVPALYQSLSAGVPPDNVFDFLETANQAARGGVTDLTTAVDGLSSVTNAYGLDVISATEAADLMFTAVKGGKTTFDELSGSLFNVIPTAAATGVEFGNITAALAAMTAQGVPTSVATTQLRQLLVEFSAAGSETGNILERLSGKTFRDFIAEGGNMQQALQYLEQEASDLGVGINEFFGSVEAGAAALALTGAGTEKFTTELNNAETAAGATAEAADLMGDSIETLEGKVLAATEALQIQTGEALEPATRAYLEMKLAIMEAALANDSLLGVLNNISTSLVAVFGGTQRATLDMIDTNLEAADSVSAVQSEYVKLLNLSGEFKFIDNTSIGHLDTSEEAMKKVVRQLALAAGSSAEFNLALTEMGNLAEQAGVDGEFSLRDMRNALLQTGETWADYYTKVHLAAQQETLASLNRETNTQGMADAHDQIVENTQGLAGYTDGVVQSTLAETDYVEVAQLVNITSEDIAEAQARREAATEAAAEADRMAAEALRRQHDELVMAGARIGDYFTAASDIPMTNDEAAQSFYDMADSYNANAASMAGLGVALGLYDEDVAETMMRNALLTASMDEIAKAFARGDLSISEAVEAMQTAQTEIMNTDFTMDTATGTMREDFAPATQEVKQAFMDAAGEADNLSTKIDQLPKRVDIDVYINQHGQVQTNLPGGTGPDGGPQFSGQHGGYTGNIPVTDVAGIVHGQEYVLPADVVRSVGVPALDRFADGDFSALSDGSGGGASIVMNFYGPTDPYEVESAVERALLRAGQSADTRIRTR